jgi:hypothetical protein
MMTSTRTKYIAIVVPILILLAFMQSCETGTAVIQVSQGGTEIISGGSYDFGGVAIGSSSAPVTFTIINTGTGSANLAGSGALAFAGSNASDFSVSTQPDLTIAAGASKTFALVFSPTAAAAESVQISLSSDVGTYSFTLDGTGTYSGTLQMYDYGDGWLNLSNGNTVGLAYLYGPGPASTTLAFRITNTNITEPLYLVGPTPVTITNNTGAYTITSYPTSPVAPNGGTSDFVIQEAYIATGTYNETVTLKTSDPTNPTFTFSVSGSQS